MDRKEKLRKINAISKLVILAIIVIALPIYMVVFQRHWLHQFDSLEAVVAFLRDYKTASILIYILLQAVQIIISIIPGQIFQVSAGFLWGFLPGLIYSLIGATIGTTVTYFLSKWLGREGLHLIFGEEKMTYYESRLNSHRAYNIVFLIYLIPGIPKDLVGYAAGISHIDFKLFLFISLVGRFFGMSGSLLFGYLYKTGNYKWMWIIGSIALTSFILCIICRKKLSKHIDKIYNFAPKSDKLK